MGRTSMRGEHIGLIYENSEGDFSPNVGLVGTSTSNAEWADFDGDRDPDVIVSGISVQGVPFTRIYRNDTRLVNAAPFPPGGLNAIVDGSDVHLTWNAGQDVETPSSGLSYALRVGTAPGASDVMNAYASSVDGHRLLPGFGNVGSNTRWRLQGLAPGIYFWSVQSIDNSFVGSEFSQEGQFTITSGGKITASEAESDLPGAFAFTGVFPNPLRDRATVTFELPDPVRVRIALYDILGKEVGMLVDRDLAAGWHRIAMDASAMGAGSLSSGTYFVRMTAGNMRENRPVVVLR
jgi:hypothetical protein